MESDHEQVFQGVFLVKHEIAKKIFEIKNESERELTKVKDEKFDAQMTWTMRSQLQKKYDGEFLALLEEVKTSQEGYLLEWIVERKSGNPKDRLRNVNVRFEHGNVGWLGNMTPAEEYYYLKAAIVVCRKQ